MFHSLFKAIRFFRSDQRVVPLYDEMLADDGLARDGDTQVPALNMGYWKHIPDRAAASIHQANSALFELVAEAASLSADDDHVVDVGCGFATNISFCLEQYPIQKMTGLNISPLQTDRGNQFLANQGLAPRAKILVGSATNMPFADATIDKVLSIEAAFHFDTRELFLREVHRVLKPGGILSLADLIVCRPRSWIKRACVRSIQGSLAVPAPNIYDFPDYTTLVERSGLNILLAKSIATDVIAPFHHWFWARPLTAVFHHNLLWSLACSGFLFADLDYIHVVAQKT